MIGCEPEGDPNRVVPTGGSIYWDVFEIAEQEHSFSSPCPGREAYRGYHGTSREH